jgi:hypothetical protein
MAFTNFNADTGRKKIKAAANHYYQQQHFLHGNYTKKSGWLAAAKIALHQQKNENICIESLHH